MRPMNVLIRLILMIAALSTLPGPAKLSWKTSFKFLVLYRAPCRPPDQPAQRKQRYADVLQTSDNPLASLKVTLDEYLMHKLASNHVCTFSQISKSRNPIPLTTKHHIFGTQKLRIAIVRRTYKWTETCITNFEIG